MSDDIVHLPRDPRPLLVPGPLGPLLRPLGQQHQLTLKTVGPLPQTLHEPPPRPDIQPEQHRRGGHPQSGGDGQEGNEPVTDGQIAAHHTLMGPHVRHDQHPDERHTGERADDPPGQLRGGQGVQPHDPHEEAHLGRRDGDGDEHDRDRPLAPQHQHQAGEQPEHHADRERQRGIPREPGTLDHAFDRGQQSQPDIEHRTPPPRPPPGPGQGPGFRFPRRGHASQPTGGGCPFSGEFRVLAYTTPRNRTEAKPSGIARTAESHDVRCRNPAFRPDGMPMAHTQGTTVRENAGDAYRGCLVIYVLQSADPYRRSPERRSVPSHRGRLVRHSVGCRLDDLTKCPVQLSSIPRGVIGSTVAFGAICPGSSPGGGAMLGPGPDRHVRARSHVPPQTPRYPADVPTHQSRRASP